MIPNRALHPALLALVASIAGAGCSDEVDVHVHALPAEELLVGSWEWQPGVSELEIDRDLKATQTSDFDNPGAAPSDYRVIPESDDLLALEGWMANAPCEPDAECDEGRAYQRHHMTYHVDDRHFLPFAMLRVSGSSGAVGPSGAGDFLALAVDEQQPTELDGEAPSETRWHLSLDAAGTWQSDTQVATLDPPEPPQVIEAASGTWTLAPDGTLTLVDGETGEVTHTLWKADVIALDGLVFTRTSAD